MNNDKEIIVIVGPTASGKSDLANNLAFKVNGEVVSADSMQIYKGMNIGTGKIDKSKQKVKHWGLDIVLPNEAYSAALYQQYSRQCFEDISSRDKQIILCGGTGFYIRAAIDDYNFPKGEQTENPIREKYSQIVKEKGNEELWNILNNKDLKSASVIHKNNTVRIIRALELLEEGKSYADQLENLKNISQKYKAKFFGLKVDTDLLIRRIDIRVDKMIENGLLDEVKNLVNRGYKDWLTSSNAIGYKELISYLEGRSSLEESINQIKIATRQYAKRQRTWFNKDKRIKWIDYNDSNIDKAINEIILYCDKGQ